MSESLGNPLVQQRKVSLLDQEHVRPLNELVRAWRLRWPDRVVPWFDPDDGGVLASTLLLMEAPGPRTVEAGSRAFCSEDNDDPTNAVLRTERESCALRRADYVKWNIVPWPLVSADGSWRAPRSADLDQASGMLTELLARLSHLRLVVAVGRAALHGWTRHQTLFSDRVIPLLAVPHPSRRNATGRDESIARLRYALSAAARVAVRPSHSTTALER